MIETIIYNRLQSQIGTLVGGTSGGSGSFSSAFSSAFSVGGGVVSGGRIYPIIATEDTQVPFVVYSVTSTESVWTLRGPTGAYQYAFSVDAYAIDFATVGAIADGIREALDGWRDTEIAVCYLDSAAAEPLEVGYKYGLTFGLITHGD